MKLSADPADLDAALKRVSRAVATRPIIPVYACVLITASEDTLLLSACDSVLSIRVPLDDALVMKPGVVAVEYRTLAQAVASAPGEVITLTADDRALTVQMTDGRVRVPLVPADAFPTIPEPGDGGITVNRAAFGAAVTSLSWLAMRNLTGRYSTNALQLIQDDDGLVVAGKSEVALGVARIACKGALDNRCLDTDGDTSRRGEMLIGAASAEAIARSLADDTIRIVPSGNHAVATDESGGIVAARQHEAQFCLWRVVSEWARTARITVERAALVSALRRALLTTDKDDSSGVLVHAHEDRIGLTTEDDKGGRTELGVDATTGVYGITGKWSTKSLLSCVSKLSGDTATLSYTDEPQQASGSRGLFLHGDGGAWFLLNSRTDPAVVVRGGDDAQ